VSRVVMIVAAHTDDEALGCGGTIARHTAEGDIVYAVFMTDGVSSRGHRGSEVYSDRNSAAERARSILGIRENFYFDLPDNRLDSIPLIEVIQPLEEILLRLQPQIIYTHHHGDLNVDHRITHQAVLTACRPMPGTSVQDIFAFEVMSSTEWATSMMAPFVPNHYVEITDHLKIKIEALKAYHIEMRKIPHSRSIQHLKCLARHRGCSVGVEAAEAFATIRTIR
jgi:LmbE family N-acetylglucosaminyl deacetylase